jgi:hypothetical protein
LSAVVKGRGTVHREVEDTAEGESTPVRALVCLVLVLEEENLVKRGCKDVEGEMGRMYGGSVDEIVGRLRGERYSL